MSIVGRTGTVTGSRVAGLGVALVVMATAAAQSPPASPAGPRRPLLYVFEHIELRDAAFNNS